MRILQLVMLRSRGLMNQTLTSDGSIIETGYKALCPYTIIYHKFSIEGVQLNNAVPGIIISI